MEEDRRVLSTVDHEVLAHRIRIAHVHHLGRCTGADGFVVWLIHSLLAISIILFLVQTGVITVDWDLQPFFQEPRVLKSSVVDGGFFYSFAPLAIITGELFFRWCKNSLKTYLRAKLDFFALFHP